MNPVNILLVDDQPAKLLSYEVILEELEENLIKAQSAREAFEHLLRTEIAVILVDVCMPEQDGFELVSMIRQHPRYQNTPIIFVSAVMLAEPDRLRGYAVGAVDYVSVPIVPEVLRAKVRVFADLYRKTRELERLNADLEARVHQRTAELEASAIQLRQLNEELEQRIDQRTREREEALAQLFEAQKLDTIGHLTGGVAHDFNNLLMAVLGSLSLLKKRLPADERSERLVTNAIQAAERGTALTQRLLAFARRQELKPQAVDFLRLFENIEDLLAKAVGPRVEIRKCIPADLAPLLVDSNQLELALLNLFVNARDALESGGAVTVAAAAEEARPTGLAGGNYIKISVSDDGEGMDEATVLRAAEPFFTTKGIGKGTGLGLSMVHGLAAQSGGSIQISSTRGKGTTVSLWLPVAESFTRAQAAAVPTAAEPVKPVSRSLAILVVDDDALVRTGTVAMLEDLGHLPREASSASQALEFFAGGQECDLVITDHAMPGMTGAELARHLRAAFPNLPVILASGYVELAEDQGLGRMLRMTKPFTQEQLQAAMDEALRDKVAAA
ncbi:sensor histidine kinase/response regulator hybrid protein (plasmid) [Rhizobium phaseoli]|uniref:response regulator n=1 Tax=Rhizobium phaseoli TaxID=396 RepID=UPI000311F9FB|nr:response regulator [Rhizobium phaseoli]ANL69439.1 sensor histidine kinase/response regulator hybrid protein [Rhizobium phaseoli]ANL75927.1 sensor histidine kinase/response regulator hybrid protein [Rhizobium phaseoli]ANL82238.1 sensor histidine kinase/response regulator hybrid protein [Rhizobium phaseoli]KKZ83788.1 sensor hybrid histidine kinase [Rhizobium phaseoli Ch24-10]RDJ05358.1 hybrid sensor histidine kinase/response regulator [Rhizobium phaseoli]